MDQVYIEQREGGYYLRGSRVSLESVVTLFRDGASPEAIADEFPTLSLEQVYGAITFYLAHQTKIDAYLADTERHWQEARKNRSPLPAPLRERLERVRDLSREAAMTGIQFITDEKGRRTAAVIDLKKHRAVWEDFEDVLDSRSRRNEKRIPWDKVKADLIKNRKLRG